MDSKNNVEVEEKEDEEESSRHREYFFKDIPHNFFVTILAFLLFGSCSMIEYYNHLEKVERIKCSQNKDSL